MEKEIYKPKFIEAGPGAGKTHAMVDEIVAAMQLLPPNRFLAAITYTNSAANTIRERLAGKVQLRRNVFIGTIHQFANRFVLSPFAELFNILPKDIIFAAVDTNKKGAGAAIYTKNLINKRKIVPFSAMIPKAREILKRPGIVDNICLRLAYIFFDEFQDADVGILEILELFRKRKKTKIYVVGDPEQYVMRFANRGKRQPEFKDIPFFRFQKKSKAEEIIENHRSNGEIVRFANQFRKGLQQKAIKPIRNEARVLFIPADSLDNIVQWYQVLSKNIEIENNPRTRLYLSAENKTFEPISDRYQLTHISNVGRKNQTLLKDALELVSLALDRCPRKILEEFDLSRLQWRSIGSQLLMEVRDVKYCFDQFSEFVGERFRHSISKSRVGLIKDDLKALKAELTVGKTLKATELYSSIHKAKGLQADATLVVAKSISELKKWLQTDYSVRVKDRTDKCRLGYVAFTRPREMLCIACQEKFDVELLDLLRTCGIAPVY